MKYMKKVKIYIFYMKYDQISKILTIFIAYSTRYSAENKNLNVNKLTIFWDYFYLVKK